MKINRNIFLLITAVIFLGGLAMPVSFAQINPIGDVSDWPQISTTTPGESPFDYYHFGSIGTGVQSDKVYYFPGEEINFKGTLVNSNEYPILNGQLYAKILRNNEENSQQNGDYIIDEFFVLENIYLLAGEHRDINFKWNIPSIAMGGNYVLATYFTVDKAYNISGINFLSNVYADFTTFEIREQSKESIYFDINNVKFNNQRYLFRAFIPEVTSKDKVEIVIPLKNTYLISKDIEISYDLYYWDGLLESNKLKSSSEIVKLEQSSSKDIVYKLDSLDKSVYFLKLTAKSGQDKSITNIRFGVNNISNARINFAGLTKFPLKKDESAKAFVTFHGITPQQFDGHIELALKNKRGKILSFESFEGPISGDVMVRTIDFKAPKNLGYLVVEAKLYDKANKLADSASIVYDTKLFGAKSVSILNNVLTYIILALIILAIIVIAYFAKKKRPPITAIPILLFLLIVTGFIGYLSYDNAVAQQSGVRSFSQRIGPYGVVSNHFTFGWNMYLTVNYDLSLIQGVRILSNGDRVFPGEPIGVRLIKNGEWNGTGKYYDSPPVFWVDQALKPLNNIETYNAFVSLSDRQCMPGFAVYGQYVGAPCDGKSSARTVYSYLPLIAQSPAYSLIGSSNVNCSGGTCTVNSTNNNAVSITATVNETYFQQLPADNGCSSPCGYYWYRPGSGYRNWMSPPVAPIQLQSQVRIGERLQQTTRQVSVAQQYADMLPIAAVSATWDLILETSPMFSVSISPESNRVLTTGSTEYQVKVKSYNGFNSSVGLSLISGLPNNAQYRFENNDITPLANGEITTRLIVTTNDSQSGNYVLNVKGVSGGVDRSATAQLKVQDFSLSAIPSSNTIPGTGSATYTIRIERINGFNSPISLSLTSGLPDNASYTFNPPTVDVYADIFPPLPAQSILRVATNNSPGGTSSLVVTGTSGLVTRTTNVGLTIPTPNCTFTSNPSTINRGASAGLLWNCSYMSSCSINQGIGSVSNVSGQRSVSPQNTTTYTLTCNNRSWTTIVNVRQPLSNSDLTCSVSPRVVRTGLPTRWQVAISPNAGTPPYRYLWSGHAEINGKTNSEFSASYDTVGLRTGTVVVTDVNGVNAQCSASVNVYRPGEVPPQ